MGIIDTKDAVTVYMARKIAPDEEDGLRQDKKRKLAEDRLDHEKVLTRRAAAAEAAARRDRQPGSDDGENDPEEKQLAAEVERKRDELNAGRERGADKLKRAALREASFAQGMRAASKA